MRTLPVPPGPLASSNRWWRRKRARCTRPSFPATEILFADGTLIFGKTVLEVRISRNKDLRVCDFDILVSYIGISIEQLTTVFQTVTPTSRKTSDILPPYIGGSLQSGRTEDAVPFVLQHDSQGF